MNKKIKELEKEIKRLKILAERDFLTGIYNREGFIRQAGKFLEAIRRDGVEMKEGRRFVIFDFSIIFVDLDGLKKLNDVCGHKTGDGFIKSAAEVFLKNLRDLDIVGRWGGDEFVIGLVNADFENSVKIAEKLKKKLSAVKISGALGAFKPSASFGIVSVGNKSRKASFNLQKLIEKADANMYEVKKGKKKGIVIGYKFLV